ncbi:MAG TPA: putative porin [Nitrospirota bacterium]
MKNVVTALLCLCMSVISLPAFAANFYEDPATGQIFTKPADGRNKVELPASIGALYQDADTGAVFTKPADGRVAVEAPAAPAAVASSVKKEDVLAALPEWMQKIKISGDFRLRDQWEDIKGKPVSSSDQSRNRERIRLRVGADIDVTKTVKVSMGLATGAANDPRSTMQTLDSSFAKKVFNLDYAYATWTPLQYVALSGGKMKNPLYNAGSDLIWDTDIRPEGVAVAANYPVLGVNTFFNGEFLVLEEGRAAGRNANMFVLQPGAEFKVTKDLFVKAAGSYYGYQGLKGNVPLTGSRASSNTLVGGKYKFNFTALSAAGEIGYRTGFGMVPFVGAFGEYIQNISANVPGGNDKASLYGVKVGYEKIVNTGDWSLRLYSRRLEKDAVPSIFPDADVFNGDTASKGSEAEFIFGLMKNVNFSLNWNDSRRFAGTNQKRQNILQADLNYRF